ncbi:hypothetical protein ACFWHQ_18795 [Streptomyces sp. NPDC060334]|uniref:hypothetical protein n=1 Tax=Streptomyces sp. NPDC060334 TaxID=3347099 RepID=UPI0036612077
MDTTAEEPRNDVKPPAEKPGWDLAVPLGGGFLASVRLGGTDGWWTALWLPLLALALLAVSYEWTLLVKARFRMRAGQWFPLVGANVSVLLGLAVLLGPARS